MNGGWVYIVTNRPDGTLYVGVTSDLPRRIWEHREGVYQGLTKRYRLNRLVWCERFEDIRDAIAHEKKMKEWHGLEGEAHPHHKPGLRDLYDELNI